MVLQYVSRGLLWFYSMSPEDYCSVMICQQRVFMGVTRKTEIHPMTEIRRNPPKKLFVLLEYL